MEPHREALGHEQQVGGWSSPTLDLAVHDTCLRNDGPDAHHSERSDVVGIRDRLRAGHAPRLEPRVSIDRTSGESAVARFDQPAGFGELERVPLIAQVARQPTTGGQSTGQVHPRATNHAPSRSPQSCALVAPSDEPRERRDGHLVQPTDVNRLDLPGPNQLVHEGSTDAEAVGGLDNGQQEPLVALNGQVDDLGLRDDWRSLLGRCDASPQPGRSVGGDEVRVPGPSRRRARRAG